MKFIAKHCEIASMRALPIYSAPLSLLFYMRNDSHGKGGTFRLPVRQKSWNRQGVLIHILGINPVDRKQKGRNLQVYLIFN